MWTISLITCSLMIFGVTSSVIYDATPPQKSVDYKNLIQLLQLDDVKAGIKLIAGVAEVVAVVAEEDKCEECKIDVMYIAKEMNDVKTEEQLEAYIKQRCSSKVYDEICTFVCESIFQKKSSTEIWTAIHLCANSPFETRRIKKTLIQLRSLQFRSKIGEKSSLADNGVGIKLSGIAEIENITVDDDDLCQACEGWISGVADKMEDIKTKEQLDKLFEQACSEQILNYDFCCSVLQAIFEEESPQEICTSLQFCEKKHLKTRKIKENIAADEDVQCVFCEGWIRVSAEEMKDIKTKEQLDKYIEQTCGKIEMCVFVLQSIFEKKSPQEICTSLHYCNDSLLTISEIKDSRIQLTTLQFGSEGGETKTLIYAGAVIDSPRVVVADIENMAIDDDALCEVCEGWLAAVADKMQDIETKEQLHEIIQQTCSIEVVDNPVCTTIIRLVFEKNSPQQICTDFEFCSDDLFKRRELKETLIQLMTLRSSSEGRETNSVTHNEVGSSRAKGIENIAADEDVQCVFCEGLITVFAELMMDFTTQEQVDEFIKEQCYFKNNEICVSAFQFIFEKKSSQEICTSIHSCDDSLLKTKRIKEALNQLTMLQFSSNCTQCKEYIAEIEGIEKFITTKDQQNGVIDELCSAESDGINERCQYVLQSIFGHKSPQEICTHIGCALDKPQQNFFAFMKKHLH